MSVFFLSLTRNAKPDIQATFIGGRLAALDGQDRPVDLFEEYNAGVVTVLGADFEWDGTAAILVPYFVLVASEDFESYALGNAGDGSTLNAAFGWDGATQIFTPYVSRSADEDFESYAVGSAGNGSGLTGGNGWNGAPSIFAY